MTTKQAIHLLRRLQDEQFDGQHGDERREALEMAVRALEGDGDTIYRQTAIEFIEYLLSEPCKGHTGDFVEGMRDGYYRVLSVIKYLPSAQPETHDKHTETHACDCISRQEAIDQLHQSYNLLDAEQRLEDLPSAQLQGKWIDDIVSYSDTGDIILANCSLCGYQMDVVYEHGYFKYCPNCGARMDGESE